MACHAPRRTLFQTGCRCASGIPQRGLGQRRRSSFRVAGSRLRNGRSVSVRHPRWRSSRLPPGTSPYVLPVAIPIRLADAVRSLADGRVRLVAARALRGGLLVGQQLSTLPEHLPGTDARVAAIYRNGQSIKPTGDTIIEHGDEVFFIAARKDHFCRVRPCGFRSCTTSLHFQYHVHA